MRRCPALALPSRVILCLLAALPAMAQQAVVVPAGPAVVMPARGMAGSQEAGAVVVPPRGGGPVRAPRPTATPRLAFTPPPPPAASLDLGSPGTMALLATVPLAMAAAVLTGSLPGIAGGGGGSGAGGSAGGGMAGFSAASRSR